MDLPSNIAAITAADQFIGPIMAQALMCLCAAADAQPNPPQHCSFRIGSDILEDIGANGDFCCEGLAYVAMGDIFPTSEGFPQPDVNFQASAKCAPLSWGVNLKLALQRCVPTGPGEGQYVIPDRDWEAAALQNVYDVKTLLQAACCTRNWVIGESGLFVGMSSVVSTLTQGTSQGGCIERSINVSVQMPNCFC